ncbi:AAA family ATPase [Paenarthrobacter sp. NPDC090520]|uniref:AAA family ATPase n=1 Tax=Paenarthrobacter sp. NPDC090520 TaxID=3364382 RepID=UPI0037F92291
MKIAIVGAHGVGKTTLTKALETHTNLVAPVPTPMHNPSPGTLKSLQDCSNEEVLRLSQRRYTERIVQEQSTHDVISDGSVLHEWVYASTRLALGIYPDDTSRPQPSSVTQTHLGLVEDFTEEALAYLEQVYDHVFFIPVEFPLPRDNAPISDRFQLEAGQQLFGLLTLGAKPVHVLTGSVEERLAATLGVLGLREAAVAT